MSKFGDPPRQIADEFDEFVVKPLKEIRDHVHAVSIVHRYRRLGWLEKLLEAAVRMAVDMRGEIVRREL